MKINDKSCYGVLESNQDIFLNEFTEKYPEMLSEHKEYISKHPYDIKELLDTKDKPKYIFSKPVKDTLTTIRVNDDFDCNILQYRETKNGVIIIDEKEMFVFGFYGFKLRVFHLKLENNGVDLEIFSFDIANNKTIVADNISEDVWKEFVRCIIYLDFLPITKQNIIPGGRVGNYTQGKVLNETNTSFIFVNKAWNQEYETLPGVKYLCRAHWGIRWTGHGRTIPKLVFVKHSLKQMHKRPTRELYQIV